ncbi:UNVERIFIED_CONTAM: uncharacterized protein DUF4190 [Acetivibrio alkalicellulosi]
MESEYMQNNSENDNSGMRPTPAKTNGLAIASLVLGILGILLLCCFYIGVIPGIIAIVLSFLAKSKIRESDGTETGNGLATAGLIMGIATIALAIVFLVISLVLGNNYQEILENLMRELENANY